MIYYWGVLLRQILLATKWEDCVACGAVTQHAVVRSTSWLHFFRIPVVLTGIHHAIKCNRCGTWTKIPWKAARAGVKKKVMPLSLERPSFEELREDLWSLTGRRPTEADIFDRLDVNRHRGPWDLYTKAWPVLVALLVVAVMAFPRQAGTVAGNPEAQHGEAHACWLSPTDVNTVNGCRLDDGSIAGNVSGTPVTCFFNEPIAETDDSIWCR
jgi:hypothetical protein